MMAWPFRREARLALPAAEPTPLQPAPINSPPKRSRRSYLVLIASICVIALVLVLERFTGVLARALDSEIFARHAHRWRLFERAETAPDSRRTQPGDLNEDPSTADADTEWSAGSAFMALAVLQLSCGLQPGGSSILDAASGTWRLSPIYCLWDLTTSCGAILHMVFRDRCPVRIAVAIIVAARNRSIRTLDPHIMPLLDQRRLEQEGVQFHILQDVRDAFLQPSRRRIVAAITAPLAVLQFVKTMAISGSFNTVGVGATLAVVYFTYWLFNEGIVNILRFSSTQLTPADQAVALALAKSHRPHWLFSVPLDASSRQHRVTRQAWNMFLGGLAHYLLAAGAALLVFDVNFESGGFSNMNEDEEGINPGWSYFFRFYFFFMPLAALFVCLWSIANLAEGLGKDRWLIHFWYSLQGSQVVLLLLLYYLRLYDSTSTFKPGWLDWFP
ncbi:hypothetical protein QBC47DRAFT_373351 [Echria macrotheca]|uniref:Uncharacterized protein n=1 Tax=Echria macrotheca TaxID=438768 RepID=A0AAJ0BL41_9PEZI|nr:hypothetical protein QBC47DRAFT_373351 [Echria macrotheca]